MKTEKKIDLGKRAEDLIEKYRFYIGLFLIVLIFAGAGVLLYRENYSKPKLESQIMNLESRIGELDKKIQETSNPSASLGAGNNQTNSNIQSSNDQNAQVAGATNASASQSVNKSAVPAGKININTASAAQLDSLVGIGVTYAQRIIEYRQSHGGFKNIEEIKNVKGIGDKTLEKFRDQITI